MIKLNETLAKIDFRLSPKAFSRPQHQVKLILGELIKLINKPVDKLLDIGGGLTSQYKPLLTTLTKKYINLEIKKGKDVDVVGSIYELPFKNNSTDIVTMFMVMEHLEKPGDGLKEVQRVLKKGGYLALTTVQYWHTHNHPSDYYRYTKAGLEYLCGEAGLKVVDVWSIGGPFLVLFHTIELNLPGVWRTIFSILFYGLLNWLDGKIYNHIDTREYSDSVGWALIAKKV